HRARGGGARRVRRREDRPLGAARAHPGGASPLRRGASRHAATHPALRGAEPARGRERLMTMRRVALAVVVAVGIIGLAAIVARPPAVSPSPDRQTVQAPIDRLDGVTIAPQATRKANAGPPTRRANKDLTTI